MTTLERLVRRLDAEARARLLRLADELRAEPEKIAVRFPAVARTVARGPAEPSDPDGLRTPRLEDLARVALLVTAARAAAWPAERLVEEVTALYRHGDADEKRAVLRALDELDGFGIGAAGLPLIRDALRTNDVRLLAAALGGYGGRHLDQHAWRQEVLKCLFVGVPLSLVDGLARRADAELARMVADHVHERVAAGRSVPPDSALIPDHFPTRGEQT